MGSGSSKPAPSSTQHVFASETPVRFSQELVDALQASPETDSTRSADLELHIQNRVAAELARLEASRTLELRELQERISATSDTTTVSTNTPAQPGMPDQSSSHGGVDHKAKGEADKLREMSRASVQKEIETLKHKLEKRRMRDDVVGDKEVERAKRELVACLRVNDRRPLDCWKEVEGFKREVARLEKGFLGRVME